MNKCKRRVLYILFCGFLSTGTASSSSPQYIRIVSFNIANLGGALPGQTKHRENERSMVTLAAICREINGDLICIQEVEPNAMGFKQVKLLKKLLNKAATHDMTQKYRFWVPKEHSGDETTAFLWRFPVRKITPVMFFTDERENQDNKPTFQRVPHCAQFVAGNYDFWLVNCHLYTRIEGYSSKGRPAEYKALSDWLIRLTSKNEKDAIVLGDFNRFLGPEKETRESWKKLMFPGHKAYYRFPLLEVIKNAVGTFDPFTDDPKDDKYSTTVNNWKHSVYDQILISRGSFHEYVDDPVFDIDAGIEDFDNDPRYLWFANDKKYAGTILSDHRPIWIRIRIDLDDDD